MKIASLIAGLTVPFVALGGLWLMEATSARALTDDLVHRVEHSVPDARVTHVNLRGRPYVVSRKNREVSTAYVDIAPIEPGAQTFLIVQALDLDTGHTAHVRVFVTLPAPDHTTAVLNADGSFSSRGTVNGTPVTFSAVLADGTVTVRGEGRGVVGTARVPAITGLRLHGEMSVTTQGLVVELVGDDVTLVR